MTDQADRTDILYRNTAIPVLPESVDGELARELVRAVVASFGTCSCVDVNMHIPGMGYTPCKKLCSGHVFLLEGLIQERPAPIPLYQRMLFVRNQRAKYVLAEFSPREGRPNDRLRTLPSFTWLPTASAETLNKMADFVAGYQISREDDDSRLPW